MAIRDDVNYFKKLNAEKRALDDVWTFSNDHRTVTFWNKTDEFIELVGSFTSVLGGGAVARESAPTEMGTLKHPN